MVINIIQETDFSFRNAVGSINEYVIIDAIHYTRYANSYNSIATIEYTVIDEDCYMRPFKFEARRLLNEIISNIEFILIGY